MSFEVDEFDLEARTGWSVLATGRVHVVDDPAALQHVQMLGVKPWADGPRDRYLRLTVQKLTGRRITLDAVGDSPAD